MHDPQARLSSTILDRLNTGDGTSSVYILWGFFALAGIAAAVAICFTPGAERRFTAAISLPPGIAAPAEPRKIATRPQEPAAGKEMLARVKALEEQLGAITGSISRAPPATVPSLPAGITPGADLKPVKTTSIPLQPAESAEPAEMADTSVSHTLFAVDLGAETSFGGLRARWDKLRKKYPDIAHLSPRIAVRDNKGKVELRLIAGPFENAADAARACAELLAKGTACDGSLFDGQRLPAS